MFTRWALKLFTRMNQQPSLKSRKYFCFSYKFDSFVYYPGTYPKLFCVDSYQYVTTPLFDSKETIYFIVFLLMKSSHNIFYFSPAFYLIMWLMKALKKLKKNIHFETMRAGFHLRCQNSLRFVTNIMA